MVSKLVGLVKRSIYFRLLIIFFATALMLFALVGGLAHYLSDPERLIHKTIQNNVDQYSTYLAEKIGNPPNEQLIQNLSNKLSLQIKISTRNKNWISQNYDLPEIALSHKHKLKHSDQFFMGHYHGYSYAGKIMNGYEYLFVVSHRKFAESKGVFLLLLVLIVISVITLSYYLVRRLFRPLRKLGIGVNQVGEGNFAFRVENKRTDEIGELVNAFNTMSSKIQSMMTEKEQLLLDVSHELRSPITRVKLALELMDDKKSKDSISDDVQELENMITELLESARLKNPNSHLVKEVVVLNDIIAGIVDTYKTSKPGIEFSNAEKQVELCVDPDRLVICLRNLLDNAMKYSNHQLKPINISITETEKDLYIKITDYGHGIPQEDREHIFEPFYRVDKSRNSKTGGYGLGLNLCQNIMRAHGGEIRLESVENQRTCFTLVFPKANV